MNHEAPNHHAPSVRQPATYRDVLDAPPNMVAELIGGALHLHPRPASRHARSSSILGADLTGPFDHGRGGPGGWWILDEPELHLGEDVLVPDLAAWRRERMPAFPDAAWFELAPDWVCEVLSPSTRRADLTDKRDIYGASGVGHLWLVDPLARTLEVFALRDASWVLVGAFKEEDAVRAQPFEAVALALGGLWID